MATFSGTDVFLAAAAAAVGGVTGAAVGVRRGRARERALQERMRQLTAAEGPEAFGSLAAQASDAVLLLDDRDQIRYASPSARSVFGTGVLADIPLPDLVDPAQRRPAEFLLRHARTGGAGDADRVSRGDWTVHARDGRKVHVEVSCRPLRPGQPAVASPPAELPGGVVVTLRDVTTQRHLEQELTRRVFHDTLTGLPNRLLFAERVSQAVAATAAGRGAVAGVLVVDIDSFKAINDGLGHDTGDAVLVAVGRRIEELVGPGEVVARLGDDEFAALLRDVTPDGLRRAAARTVVAAADPIPLPGGPVSCTVSVGLADSGGVRDASELLQRADLALAAAKGAGHGQWRQYHPGMAAGLTDRAALRADLGRAVHDGTLSVDYQPIVALDSGRAVGWEALLRWQHPTRGRLPAEVFIDVAEESGLVLPIGEQVLATAMATARRWSAAGQQAPPYVGVNVSPQQFRAHGFMDTVQRLLETTGLRPVQLVLELTESSLLRDDDKVWGDLYRLRRQGVRVAIDDFGTGYSALSYLRHAPLDVVKLDRTFTSSLTASARQRELVAGIVGLAGTLGLEVVAEGIETDAQRRIAAGIGCGYGQGYLFGRPAPVPDQLTPPLS